jgi:hypothetical protein
MIHSLTNTLKAILEDTSLPALVRDAEIEFGRPSDTYAPAKRTINLFLYDVRENVELRSNEAVTERVNGVVTIRRPPLRVSCSYLVTAWIESSVTGEQAILSQHELLGAVLKVFSRTQTVDARFLQGDLLTALYGVSLAAAQADLVRNPAEFWSALGGKLRPSFTVTATIALDPETPPIEAPQVVSSRIQLEPVGSGAVTSSVAIGGTVTDSVSNAALAGVALLLMQRNVEALSDDAGRFQFSGVAPGNYSIRAVKTGYRTQTKAIQVPGNSPTAFDIALTPT